MRIKAYSAVPMTHGLSLREEVPPNALTPAPKRCAVVPPPIPTHATTCGAVTYASERADSNAEWFRIDTACSYDSDRADQASTRRAVVPPSAPILASTRRAIAPPFEMTHRLT